MIGRKPILRVVSIIGLVLIVAGIMAIVALRSRAFHRYVLARMVQKASQATGAQVTIGDFQFHWSGLRVALYQIALHAADPVSGPPLLQLDHLGVGLKIISIWRRKID